MPREVAIQQQQAAAVPAPAYSFAEKMEMARMVASSGLFPNVTNPQSAMTLMMLCEADGLHPVEAMRRYHILHGRPAMRADAMQAEFQAKGGRVEWVESTEEACEAMFRHAVHAPNGFPVRVTIEEAKERGLYNTNPNYKKYPRQMLRARCISEGVRAVLPGIVVGVYTPEEVEGFERSPKVVNVTPAASQADAIGDELVQQLDAPTPREKARRRQEERYPEPKGNPKDRHPAPEDVAAALDQHDARTYQEVISDIVRGADAEWAETARRLDIEPDPKNPVVNAFQVENHITTWALGAGVLKPEHVEVDGKRDRKMMVDALSKLHRRNPDRFVGLVASYVAEKLAERTKAAEAVVYGEPEPSQEPATPAEDVSQDVVEEVHGEGDDRVVIERREVAHA
jgi:hypothetical protein